MPDPYTTELTPKEEALFSVWRKTLPTNLQNDTDYDLRGAFKDGLTPDDRNHFNDKYKKPNHITFSDQSMYHSGDTPGGQWKDRPDGGSDFYPSAHNIQNTSPQTLLRYFSENEPTSSVVFPWEYSVRALMRGK